MEENVIEQLLDWVRNRYFGKYRGTVIDNDDPTSKGRVRVSVPAVLGELQTWAMPCVPYTGANAGHYLIPETGAGVWVEFEAGDPSFPIWTGGFWADNETPRNEQHAPPVPQLKIIRTRSGLMVSMDDNGQVITLSDSDGSNMLTIEVMQGKIRIKGAIKAVVEAPMIELVESSTHPVVFGDELMSYLTEVTNTFNTHMHPGELAAGILPVTPAPPVPPMMPPTPILISTRVKTG